MWVSCIGNSTPAISITLPKHKFMAIAASWRTCNSPCIAVTEMYLLCIRPHELLNCCPSCIATKEMCTPHRDCNWSLTDPAFIKQIFHSTYCHAFSRKTCNLLNYTTVVTDQLNLPQRSRSLSRCIEVTSNWCDKVRTTENPKFEAPRWKNPPGIVENPKFGVTGIPPVSR